MRKKVSFDQLLERCLQDLARTGDVEVSLRRYPQHADQLRPLLETAQATRRCYADTPKAPGGLAAGRERMLAAAAQQRVRGVAPTTVQKKRAKLALATRLAAVLITVALGAIFFGGGIIWAADDSLPGDSLYMVKLVAEDMRLALTSAPGEQVKLALQLTERRADEAIRLAVAGQPASDAVITRMEQHIELALAQTAWSPDEETAGLLAQIAARTRIQEQRLEQSQATASQHIRSGLERAAAICRKGAEAAENGLIDLPAFRRLYCHPRGTPEPAPSTPSNNQEQEPYRDWERTPEGTPHAAPHGSQGTPRPQFTSPKPQATREPQATPQGPQTTREPQPTSRGPQATPEPSPSPQGPQVTSEPPEPQGPQATSEPPGPQGPQATSEPPGPQGPQATSEPPSGPAPQGPQATPGSRATPRGP